MKSTVKPLKVIFFGNERLATGVNTHTPVLHALYSAGHKIELVVANAHHIRSRQNRPLEIIEAAQKLNLPHVAPTKLDEIEEIIRSIKPDIGVLIAYGRLIPPSIIKLFPHGIINLHPSLLPQYRGSTPIESAILDGRDQTGVSIMRLTPEMDAGPIYGQSVLKIDTGLSKQQLCDKLLELGRDLIINFLPKIAKGTLRPAPQDESVATYTKLIHKNDGQLDPAKPADILEREIRAYAGWPGSYLKFNDETIKILSAQVAKIKVPTSQLAKSANQLYFGCYGGALTILQLQIAGKKPITGRDLINARPSLPSI